MQHLNKILVTSGLAFVIGGGAAGAAVLGVAPSTAAADTATAGDPQIGDHGPFGADIFATAATYIGISEADLRTQLQAGKSLADVAVANGKTRDGLIAALTAAATTRIGQLVDQKGLPAGAPGHGGPGRGGPGFGFGMMGDQLSAAATYLGTTTDALRTKVQSGQSLAQIANATSGKSRDGLIQALVADANAKIDQAQKDGKLTADQASQAKAGVTDRVTRFVDSTPPAGGPRGPRPSGAPAPFGSPRP